MAGTLLALMESFYEMDRKQHVSIQTSLSPDKKHLARLCPLVYDDTCGTLVTLERPGWHPLGFGIDDIVVTDPVAYCVGVEKLVWASNHKLVIYYRSGCESAFHRTVNDGVYFDYVRLPLQP